ncbi:recombinase [Halostreptopolyspora alba]|uniref:Recombinase n=2 Tax=Halostreptopolyspora alba TaxID=2487137 RepID=A0A3N0EAJ8_9ACTN|nr:recombinase [Nocardiopsaceae bacterium YIM 96095]
MRAATYARVSTEEQTRGYGIETQIEGCAEYIDRKGWTPAQTYIDEGVSGSLTSRPALDRLLADAEAGRIDVVVVHKYNRIGRVGRAFWRYIWALQDLEVGFVSATQEIVDTTTPTGMAQLQMYAMFAEMDYNTIRDQLQDGLQAKARSGGWVGGQPPYGWRIEGLGRRGSYLVVDEAESAILRTAHAHLVERGLDVGTTTARLNAMGMVTRSGRPWSVVNLRARLLAESTTEARVVFRNPARATSGRGAKLTKDGKPQFGESVVIELPPIFEPDEVAELRQALRPTRAGVGPERRTYPLSGRVFGQCGAHHVGGKGGKSGREVGPVYKCKGRVAHHPGAERCADSQIPAAELEQRVWDEVVRLLGDPDRLKAMAAEWAESAGGSATDHAGRIADLDRQIAERNDAVTRTVTEYARAGLPTVAVEAATRALTEELQQLEAMRAEAQAWQAETETAREAAADLEALATTARDRLADTPPDGRAEVLELLDVRVTVTGPVPLPQVGKPCSLAKWFVDRNRPVPEPLTDQQWAEVEPVVAEWERAARRWVADSRTVVEAILYKARTGARWRDLPPELGNWKAVHTRYKKWVADGTWDAIGAALPTSGAPVGGRATLPPLRVEGRVDPRVLGAETDRPETGVPGPITSALSVGCHQLLRDNRAVCVTAAQEIAEQVGPLGADLGPSGGAGLPHAPLDAEARRVLEAVPGGPGAGVASIAVAAEVGMDATLRCLGLLAAAGFVERGPSGWRVNDASRS